MQKTHSIDKIQIIMHDNLMHVRLSISDQLRQRRRELGLSLADVARRAGTSAATLSRYENGWTRFETYTLRKLALALNCELEIVLSPKASSKRPKSSSIPNIRNLSRLFWDHPFSPEDVDKHTVWVVERVLEFGSLSDIALLREYMGKQRFLEVIASTQRLSPKTATFWNNMLHIEGISCTKKYSRNTAWNC